MVPTNKYNMIDLTKFICSFLVMIIHVPFVNNLNGGFFSDLWFYLKNSICRIAVPLFYCYSGFFLFSKMDSEKFSFKPILKYLAHILILYLFWTFIYMLLDIKDIISNPIIMLSFLRKTLLITYKSHLWYLHGLIVSVLLVSILLYFKVRPKPILIISSFLLLIGILGNGYLGLFKKYLDIPVINWYFDTFETTRNGLFFGFFFVSLGLTLKDYTPKLEKKHLLALLILSIISLILESIVLSKYIFQEAYDMLLFLVPSTILTFLLTKSTILKDNKCYALLRKMSTVIYLIHPLIFSILICFFKDLAKQPYLFYITSIIFIIPVAYLLIKLSEYKNMKFLKRLY